MRRHIRSIGGLVAGVILGATAVAVAAIPDSNTGVISACMRAKDGTLRIIDFQAGRRCITGETLITWNQKGVPGAAGAAGAQGPQGAQGVAGPAGTNGAPGRDGIDGAQGPQGATGPQGPHGDTGVQGPIGAEGPIGPKGDPGADGAPGPGPMIVGVVGQTRTEPGTNGLWEPLPNATTAVPPQAFGRTGVVTFWAATACFGTGSKYAQLYLDGVATGDTPLGPIPNSGFAESSDTITQVVTIPAGHTLDVAVKVRTDPGTYCVFTEQHWSLSVVTTSSS